jgi:hexosaminidase
MTRRRFGSVLFFAFVYTGLVASGQDHGSLDLMPLLAHVTVGAGQFVIDGSFAVTVEDYGDPRVVEGRRRFMEALGRETGIPFAVEAATTKASFVIHIGGPGEAVQQLGEDESYHLAITSTHVELSAANPLGILHGLQTFLQLVRVTPQGFSVPVVTIDDQPRFPWRGLMIDVGRHFQPLAVIERNLDGMEAVKLNVFHWHLSEDQGFRVESKQFPLLQEKGSGGRYYTQEQVHEVIDYARERGIRVVPEFDMPCHTTAWFAAYPQYASAAGPFKIETKWGVFDPAMDPTREATFEFLDKLIGEMTALYPDAYFHIGGDECNGKEWNKNPRIQAFMKEHGIKDNAALQSYFTGRVQKLVVAHNKIPEGWDEVLQPDTPKNVVIQSWRGPQGLAQAARQGNQVLLSNGYYIDLNQSAAEHYLVDPLGGEGEKLTVEQKARVLGGEATMWSEFVTPENIDSRIWPRTAAIAERFWSPQEVRDVDSMYRRMAIVSQKLEYCGLQHNSSTRMMLERMSVKADPQALEVLASALQPPQGYERESLHEYNSASPLNRMVDAVPPESETARRFAQLAILISVGNAPPKQWQEAHDLLVMWRDNDAKLEPELSSSELTAELSAVSHSLSQVAAIGLQSLDDLKNHRVLSADARAKNMQLLKAAAKPRAVLVDEVASPVELLVNASAKQ